MPLNDNSATPSQDVFKDKAIFNFVNYVFIANVNTIFKYIHSVQLNNFSTFTLTSSVSQCTTRASLNNKIDAPLFASKADNLCFLSATITSWNKLTNDIIGIQSFKNF